VREKSSGGEGLCFAVAYARHECEEFTEHDRALVRWQSPDDCRHHLAPTRIRQVVGEGEHVFAVGFRPPRGYAFEQLAAVVLSTGYVPVCLDD
jgi:hypothetical protein